MRISFEFVPVASYPQSHSQSWVFPSSRIQQFLWTHPHSEWPDRFHFECVPYRSGNHVPHFVYNKFNSIIILKLLIKFLIFTLFLFVLCSMNVVQFQCHPLKDVFYSYIVIIPFHNWPIWNVKELFPILMSFPVVSPIHFPLQRIVMFVTIKIDK